MSSPARSPLSAIVRTAVSLTPWVCALYLLYWLEHSGVWSADMPLRALFSLLIIAVGMLLSFVLHTGLGRRLR